MEADRNVRWRTPFRSSLSFRLFMKHFTELNAMYWAHVPAVNKIEKCVSEEAANPDKKPLDFFIVRDVDDRRVAGTFDEWKNNYHNFQNFVRLNSLLSLISCFEVYLRSIVSLSIESKPGLIWGMPDAIDGVILLKGKKDDYFTYDDKYPFFKQVDSVCRGMWADRFAAYERLFGSAPSVFHNNVGKLDEMRKLRNDIAHYFSREKSKYESPVTFHSEPVIRLRHDRLIGFLGLTHSVIEAIDAHLYLDFVGSYEMIKYYFMQHPKSIEPLNYGIRAKWLQKDVGNNGGQPIGTDYYKQLLLYYDQL